MSGVFRLEGGGEMARLFDTYYNYAIGRYSLLGRRQSSAVLRACSLVRLLDFKSQFCVPHKLSALG